MTTFSTPGAPTPGPTVSPAGARDPRSERCRGDADGDPFADRVIEQLVEILPRRDRLAFDLQDVVARPDSRDRRRAERDDRRYLQPSRRVVLRGVEIDREAPQRRLRALRWRRDTHVGRVQLAEHERDDAAHFVRCAGAGDARLVRRPHRVPVHAVHLLVDLLSGDHPLTSSFASSNVSLEISPVASVRT